MENILSFFAELPNHYKLLWVLICLSVSWLLEFAVPLVELNYRKWRHAGINLVFFSTSLIINILFGIATVGIFLWTGQHEFGLFYFANLPIWVELLLAVMILDFVAQYVAHYLLHRVAWMWKFHLVHHSDKMISIVFITPNMHKFHHHYERPWTDSNFGNIFSFWDRIFGTLVYGDPKQVQYGVDVVDPSKSEDLLYQFKLPFDSSIKTD